MKAKTIRSLPKARLLAAGLLLFLSFLIHESCTKLDTSGMVSRTLTDEEITQKFFNVPANAPLAVRRAADEMRKRNGQSEFVRQFAALNGYPLWKYAKVSRVNATASFSGSSAVNGPDTLVTIPVSQPDTNFVKSFISVKLSGSAELSFYRGSDYSSYTFDRNVPTDSITAEKAALQIMMLNRDVYGYKRFRVADKRLFSYGSYPDSTARYVTLTDGTTASGNPSNLYEVAIICYEVDDIVDCSTQTFAPGSSGSNVTSHFCHAVTTHCTTTVYGSSGSGSGGDGSGGGSTPPSNFPCASSQGKGIAVANPCGGTTGSGNGGGSPPVYPAPTKSPCDEGQDLLNTPGVVGKYDELKNYVGGDREMAYSFNASGGAVLTTGLLYQHRVDIQLVQNWINYTHIHNAGSSYYMFSWNDIDKMQTNFTSSDMAANATVSLIAPDSTPYIMTIQNPVDFANSIGSYKDMYSIDKEREEKYLEYFSDASNSSEKVLGFLKYMKDIGAPITLLRIDGCCDLVQIKLNAAGTALEETPCNPA